MPNPLKPSYSKPHAPKKEARPSSSYLKYAHLSFQMMAIIGVGVGIGIQLDAYSPVAFPVFLSIFAPASTAYAVYATIKGIS